MYSSNVLKRKRKENQCTETSICSINLWEMLNMNINISYFRINSHSVIWDTNKPCQTYYKESVFMKNFAKYFVNVRKKEELSFLLDDTTKISTWFTPRTKDFCYYQMTW